MAEEEDKTPDKPDTLIIVEPESEGQQSKRHEQERTTISKKIFLEAFELSMGIITISANAANIARETYYDWLRDDPVFKERAMLILVRQRDQVEDRLLKCIKKDAIPAIIFYLKNKHPDYKDKLAISAGDVTLEDIIDKAQKQYDDYVQSTASSATTPAGKPPGEHSENPQQAGPDSAVQNEQGAEVLLAAEDAPQPGAEIPPGGIIENN